MTARFLLERRRVLVTTARRIAAPRRKRAPDDRLGKRWHRARDFSKSFALTYLTLAAFGAEFRDRVQQPARIRVQGVREQFGHRRLLDLAPGVHDDHSLRHFR